MAITTGQYYVQAPNPIVPRYGLFAAASGPWDLPYQAINGGLEYEIAVCDLPLGYTVNCQQDHATKTFQDAINVETGYPFVVYSSISCGAVGLTNERQERVRRFLYQQLVAGEQATVENIFSTSAFGQTEGLANNAATVNLGTAAGPVEGVSILESWLYARYGLPGVLHVPSQAAAYVDGAKLLHRDTSAQPWRTAQGTVVSLGNYAGVNPTGGVASAGTTWLYITGQVAVWRTPDSRLLDIPVGQVLNRSTNTVEIVMEREYVVSYDCYAAGVQVTLDTTDQ